MAPELFVACYPHEVKFAECAESGFASARLDYSRFDCCPRCGNSVSGAYWMRPREVVLTSRNTPDFLYTYWGCGFLVSEKVLKVVQAEKISGIRKVEEIETVRFQRKSKTNSLAPKYFYIELERSKITIDHSKSLIVYGKIPRGASCPLCRPVSRTYDFFRSLALNTDCYEGYDIFQTYEMGGKVFFSKHFVEVCNKHSLTNLFCVPTEEYGRYASKYTGDENESNIS